MSTTILKNRLVLGLQRELGDDDVLDLSYGDSIKLDSFVDNMANSLHKFENNIQSVKISNKFLDDGIFELKVVDDAGATLLHNRYIYDFINNTMDTLGVVNG